MPARIAARRQLTAGLPVPLPPTVYAVSAANALLLTVAVPAQRGPAVTSFAIYRGTVAGGQALTPVGTITLAPGALSGTFNDTGLTNGTTYFYVARALSAAGMSLPGPEFNLAPASTVNLLAQSGSLGQMGVNGTSITPGYPDPNGDATALRVQITTGGGGISQSGTTTPTNGLQSLWVKSNTGASQTLTTYPASGNAQTFTATTAWTRVSNQIGAQMFNFFTTGSTTADLLIWHPQLEDLAGTTPSAYAGT